MKLITDVIDYLIEVMKVEMYSLDLRGNIVYVGSDKQEREIFAEGIVTPAFVDAHSQKV